MINHKAVQKSINARPPDKTALLIYIQVSYLTTKMYVQCAQKNCHIKMVNLSTHNIILNLIIEEK